MYIEATPISDQHFCFGHTIMNSSGYINSCRRIFEIILPLLAAL